MKRFVVVGLGSFGTAVAEGLAAGGHDVVVIDRDQDAVDAVAPVVTHAACGDGRSLQALEQLGAAKADAAIVHTGDDLAAAVLATMALRDLGVERIYVKVTSAEHARALEKLGVTETVFPERESGLRLARRVATPHVLNDVRLGEDFSIQEVAVPEAWVGRTLRQLELPRAYRLAVVAVRDVLQESLTTLPDPDRPLLESNTVLLAGRAEHLARLGE